MWKTRGQRSNSNSKFWIPRGKRHENSEIVNYNKDVIGLNFDNVGKINNYEEETSLSKILKYILLGKQLPTTDRIGDNLLNFLSNSLYNNNFQKQISNFANNYIQMRNSNYPFYKYLQFPLNFKTNNTDNSWNFPQLLYHPFKFNFVEKSNKNMNNKVQVPLPRNNLEWFQNELESYSQRMPYSDLIESDNLKNVEKNNNFTLKSTELNNNLLDLDNKDKDFLTNKDIISKNTYLIPKNEKKTSSFNNDFWAPRGKKEVSSLNDDFWAPRGKKSTLNVNDDFWTPRGKKDISLSKGNTESQITNGEFWAPRGKKNKIEQNHVSTIKFKRDRELANLIMSNRHERSNAVDLYGKDFWVPRGKRNDDKDFWVVRGKK